MACEPADATGSPGRSGYLRRFGRAVAGCTMAATLATSCDVSSMAFVRDERVRIVEPADRSHASLPITLRWEVRDFAVTGRDGKRVRDAGYFAVFVDHPPIPPRKTLEWFARQDDSCGGQACGTIDNLADVYTTEDTTLKLTRLPAFDTRGGVERHEVVVVLLDGTGARIGESAFYVRFTFERRA